MILRNIEANMENGKKKIHTEVTAAETKSIGFDYQYYFFLSKLLSLKSGETVGLEVKDDVHTELSSTKQILFQLKHTVAKRADNNPINLTSRDKDLWKTLSNWSKIIRDEVDGRKDLSKQLEFLEKTDFVLVTNKSSNSRNKLLDALQKLKLGEINFSKIKDEIIELKKGSESVAISSYFDDVLALEEPALSLLLLNLHFRLDEDDIIEKCKLEIKAKMIGEKRVDDVFGSLDSAIRADNYIKVKSGMKIEISFNDFYKKYRRHYDLGRNNSLPVREYEYKFPTFIEDQVFIRQLLDIKGVSDDDNELMVKYTRFKLKIQNNISEWLQSGELTGQEVIDFKNDIVNQWRNKFMSTYRGKIAEDQMNSKALSIFDYMLERSLKLAGQELDSVMSNGGIYDLSNVPVIGWRKAWEKKYKQGTSHEQTSL